MELKKNSVEVSQKCFTADVWLGSKCTYELICTIEDLKSYISIEKWQIIISLIKLEHLSRLKKQEKTKNRGVLRTLSNIHNGTFAKSHLLFSQKDSIINIW